MKRAVLAMLLAAVGTAAVADDSGLSFKGQWRQGVMLIGHAPQGTKIVFDGHDMMQTLYGTFVIGLDRDEKTPAELQVTLPGQASKTLSYPVTPGKWEIQRINGLPKGQVNPPEAVMARIHRESQEIRNVRAKSSDLTGFTQHFIWPVHGRISSVFGSQRILDGEPKQPHYGVDVAVPSGTPVKAAADGVVSLVAQDLYFTGGTLMIDHGHGVQSVYCHLSKITVKTGEAIKQGQVIALSGQSGRATGPNLHWGVSWFDHHVDAASLSGPMPRR